MAKLEIRKAKVVFYNPIDNGFGRSITIEITQENWPAIAKFWADNNIGNEKTEIGVPNIKEYEGQHQMALKINDHTKYAGLNGLTTDDIGYGSLVDLYINSFEYNNKFTKGKSYVGASVSAVLIVSGKSSGGTKDLEELMSGYE